MGGEAECGGDRPSCAHLGNPRPPVWALFLGADSLTQAELTPKRRCEPVFEKATSWDGIPRGRRQLRLPSMPLQACVCHHGRAHSTEFAYTGIHVPKSINSQMHKVICTTESLHVRVPVHLNTPCMQNTSGFACGPCVCPHGYTCMSGSLLLA